MFPKYYVYKITFSNNATYIGCHIEKKENDGYICSSTYFKRHPELKYKKEILMYLPTAEQMNIMESLIIIEDKCYSPNNVNGNYGNWITNFHSSLDSPWNKGLKMSEEFKKKISETESQPLICIETGKVLNNTQENGHYAEAARGIRKTVGGFHYRKISKEEKEKILNGNIEETKRLNKEFLIKLYENTLFYYCLEYDIAFENISMIAGMLGTNELTIKENLNKCYKGFTIKVVNSMFIFDNNIKVLKIKKEKKIYSKIKCIETGEIFDSVKEAENKLNCGHISSVLNGSRKTAGGFHWERYNE